MDMMMSSDEEHDHGRDFAMFGGGASQPDMMRQENWENAEATSSWPPNRAREYIGSDPGISDNWRDGNPTREYSWRQEMSKSLSSSPEFSREEPAQLPTIPNLMDINLSDLASRLNKSIYIPPPLRPENRFALASVDTPLDNLVSWRSADVRAVGQPRSRSSMQGWGQNLRLDENVRERQFNQRNANNFSSDEAGSLNGSLWDLNDCEWYSPPSSAPYEAPEAARVESLQSQYERLMRQDGHHNARPGNAEASPQRQPEGGVAEAPPPSPKPMASYSAVVKRPPPPPQQSLYFTPSVTLDPGAKEGRVSIFVVPLREFNFTDSTVQFYIQTFNVPPKTVIKANMLQTVIRTPKGKRLPCAIKKDRTYMTRVPISHVRTYVGYFKATREVGMYTIRVRLILPLKNVSVDDFKLNFGVARDSVQVLVTRDYWKHSKKSTGYSFQVELGAFEKINEQGNLVSAKAWGLACDKKTNWIYVTERVANRVSCLDPRGRVLFRFDTSRPTSQLNRPTGICCDEANRRVIICDKDHHRICFFTMDGHYVSSFGQRGNQDGQLSYPWDVDASPDGTRIVVADARNQRIQIFDATGNFVWKYHLYGQSSKQQRPRKLIDYPRGVTFDQEGKIVFVTDFNTPNVIMVPVGVSFSRRLLPEGKLVRPQGIVVDRTGILLVADSRGDSICHMSRDGQILNSINGVGATNLQYPVNLALLRDGHLAVLDGQGKVHIF